MNGSLTIVGTGIKFISHITTEAIACIEQSSKVLYLVNDPAIEIWLQRKNSNTKSLNFLYTKYNLRSDCYNAITEYILDSLKDNSHVCVVLYGHPAVFATPGLDAVVQAKKKGIDACILPGISAEDCLFADLLIDPSTVGCQSFEATDFLIYERKPDISSHLILWQIGFIGILTHPISHDNSIGLKILVKYLKTFYNHQHEVIIYEAAQYPRFSPKIEKVPLLNLSDAAISTISTLYIPPAYIKKYNLNVLHSLNIDLNHAEEFNEIN